MNSRQETVLGLIPHLKRLVQRTREAWKDGVRRPEFEVLCQHYTKLAEECGTALKRHYPGRFIREDDYDLVPGQVKQESFEELHKMAENLLKDANRFLSEDGAMRCPWNRGLPCQMREMIKPGRHVVFFALPFDESKPCLPAANELEKWLMNERGLRKEQLFRADQRTGVGNFVCKVCQAIQEAKVMVADITLENPNVYLELGMAFALGKPTILLFDRNTTPPKIGSDIQSLEHVEYRGNDLGDPQWLQQFGEAFDLIMSHCLTRPGAEGNEENCKDGVRWHV